MLKRLKKLFGGHATDPTPAAASKLRDIAPPRRLKRGLTAVPSIHNTANPDPKTAIRRTDRRLATVDISRISRQQGTWQLTRELAHSSPDLSASLFTYLRTAITKDYTAIAYNMDGTVNPEGTKLVQELLTRFDLLPDYSEGFAGMTSIRSIAESWGKELWLYGGCSGELVLGPDRLPQRIQPLSITNIEFYPDKEGIRPVQTVGGEDIDLDIATFFYTALDMELMEAYPSSPVESAIKPTFFAEQFQADIQRVVRRAIHPRINVVIDYDTFVKNMPPEAQHDQDKADQYYEEFVSSLETQLNSLEPEEALVYNDMITISLDNNGNISLSQEYQTLEALTNAKMATGAKIMPVMLGHSNNGSNIASTETLIFMQSASGAIQFKINEMFSKILTLGLRLFGLDVYAKFEFDTINLRPESELEPFKQAKQSRILELLSLGILTDEQAAIELTGHLPPEGYKSLSGTMFRSAHASDENRYNDATNSGSALNQNLDAGSAESRGSNNRSNPVKEGTHD